MNFLPLIVLPALLIIAAISDVTTMTIPNWISGLLVISFAVLGAGAGLGLMQMGAAFGVGAVFLVFGMVFFALGWLGGGDAKLIAATVVWFGWPAALSFIVCTALAGGVATLVLLTLRKVSLPHSLASVPWVGRLHSAEEELPYGVAIAAGGLFALPQAPLMALMGL